MRLPNEDVREGAAERFDKYLQIMRVSTKAGPLIIATWHAQPANYLNFDYLDGGEGSAYADELDQAVLSALLPFRGLPRVVIGDLNAPNAHKVYKETFKALDLQDPLINAGPTRARGTRTAYNSPARKLKSLQRAFNKYLKPITIFLG